MLAIRMQRVGRTGYATYRLTVQESWRHPSSGRIIAYVGNYNPHTKESNVQVELAQKYLDNGAQPSPRVVKLLKDAGVKLPKWVVGADKKVKTTRHAEKLRKNRPAKEAVAAEEVAEVEAVEEAPKEVIKEPEAETSELEVTEEPVVEEVKE